MIEMSVDKKTALSSDESGDPSLPPPSQQHRELSGHCPRNSQQPTETSVAKLAREDEEHRHKMANVACRPVSDGMVAATDSSIQSQNGVQQPRPHQQQRLNKRRSTMSSSFKHPVFGKRRRRANSESESVLPTNFLLGGNIFDPLNLNSLLDEEVNRALNAETPKSSPLPAKSRDPVEILIPRDITDPLNLNGCTAGDGGLLLTPLKSSGGRRRHRNRHHGGAGGGAGGTGGGTGKGGDGGLTQLDPSESERGKASSALQTERTVESSALHLKSGGVAEGPDPKVPEEEAVESSSVPIREAQCNSGPASANILEEREDRATAAPVSDIATPTVPILHAPTTPSHRQRKRKRTTSRSESSGTACWDKSRPPRSAPGSVQPTQPVRTPATGAQAGAADRPHQPPNHRRQQRTPSRQKPKQPQQQQKFQYGNYNKYYGYRNPGSSEDPRVHVLQPEWFQGKAVLDLGCNTGHLTLSIAKSWRPARIVGLDIDGALIHAARQNIRHYLSEVHTLQARSAGRGDESTVKGTSTMQGGGVELEGGGAREKMEADSMEVEEQRTKAEKGEGESDGMVPRVQEMDTSEEGDCVLETGRVDGESTAMEMVSQSLTETGKRVDTASSNGNHLFPVSLRMSRGPIAAPPLPDTNILPPGDFPANVTFVKGNYVLESDLLLQTQREEFDVVLCLSVTKWVHLNWGDGGLKRLFHRVYRHLRPGGLFILEPQPWSSYSKRKKLTEAIYKNYYSIRFRPEQFSAYLTSEVGFSSYELIGTPKSSSRGFQRPIYLFHKGPAPRK